MSAVYFAGRGDTGLRHRMMALSRIHVAVTLVACYADRACPGDRPWSAGDIISAAAARAYLTTVSIARSRLWGRGIHEAVVEILETRSEEAAKALASDIILLVLEVLP